MLKERLTTGWTFIRVLYLGMGILLIAQSIAEQRWLGLFIGGYFSAMGLFRFGCASGSCYGGSCNNYDSPVPENGSKTGVEFEEIKSQKN